jgi:hypothetical protein
MKPLLTLTAIATLALAPHLTGETTGWLNWRGPLQTGASLEKDLPSDLKIGNELWTFDVQGAGTPTIADGRLYAFGFYGEKAKTRRKPSSASTPTPANSSGKSAFPTTSPTSSTTATPSELRPSTPKPATFTSSSPTVAASPSPAMESSFGKSP